jgi:hypothetical protein
MGEKIVGAWHFVCISLFDGFPSVIYLGPNNHSYSSFFRPY